MPATRLSVLLVTPDTWTTWSTTLAALRTQTIRDRIELVLVGPALDAIDVPDSEVTSFAAVRKVAVPNMARLGRAYAEGVRASTAPLIALTEDHCFPETDWAEALLRRHDQGDWAAVGPTMINGNPDSAASWTQFIVEYGNHSTVGEKGVRQELPGHNSCYRRDALLFYEPRLEWWLECETVMQWDMTRRGLRLYADPAVRTHHWNCSRFWPTVRFSWLYSRVFAAYRATQLNWFGHAKLALLWPVIPLVRLRRTWPLMKRQLGLSRALQLSPGVFLNFLVSGASEGLGYIAGVGEGWLGRCFDLEFHRDRFLRDGEAYRPSELPATATDVPSTKWRTASGRQVSRSRSVSGDLP